MPKPKTNANTIVHRRSCPTCEACCGLLVSIDPKTQQILSIKGDDDDHRSKGYVCAKSQAFYHVHKDPERLQRPVKRVGAEWVEISWQEAFATVSEKLNTIREQYGKDAIAFFVGNPTGHDYSSNLYLRSLMELLKTERFFSAGTIDQHPQQIGSWVLYGEEWLFPIPDIDHTDLLIIMGANPAVSQGSLMGTPDIPRRLRELKARGGRCVVIDPRRTETAKLADQHIFIRPGTDAFMLLAMINVLDSENLIQPGRLGPSIDGIQQVVELAREFTPEQVEPVTGIPALTIKELTREYAATQKSALYARIGLCSQEFGTVASWLVDVLSILTGKLDERGGMMFPLPAHGAPVPGGKPDLEAPFDRHRSRVRDFPETCGELPAALMAEEITAPGKDAVKALIVQCGNPVLSVPNGKQLRDACKKLDFMVCFDIYINETTSMADIILPSVSHLERSNYDLLFSSVSSRNYVSYSPKSLEPPPDSRELWEIIGEVAASLAGMTLEQLDDAMFDGIVGAAVKQAQAAGRELDPERVRSAATCDRGPERLLDVLLRNGPYGDHFDDAKEGLSLEKLKNIGGLMDLGPLQPRFPAGLKTPKQRINLIHPQISQDFERIKKRCEEIRNLRANGELLLIGRRHIRDMNSWLHNLPAYTRGKKRCTLMIHPQDAQARGLAHDGEMAKIRSNVGEQTVEIELCSDIMPGVVSLPHGFGHIYGDARQSLATAKPGVSCNDLIDHALLDIPSGTSIVNGVSVSVERSP